MTLRKPDESSPLRWMLSGFNFKTLVTAIVLLVSAHYLLSSRLSVVEANSHTIEKRQDVQRDQIQQIRESKVDLGRYAEDQARLLEDLRAIRDSQGRIENILMQPQFHR